MADTAAAALDRRRFLGYLVAAPALTIAARIGFDARAAHAQVGIPEMADQYDLTDLLMLCGTPTYYDLKIEITPANRVLFELPRMEVGQGVMTAVTMIVAEELDAAMADMDTSLSPAEPRRLMGQLTGGSHSIRSMWDPARTIAAEIRARLVTAAAQQWDLPAGELRTENTHVIAPDGRTASYGSLTEAAAGVLVPEVAPTPKPFDEFRVIGQPHNRIDARDIVTGRLRYTLDTIVPDALPTVLALPPTLGATVVSYDDTAAMAMPGVAAVAQIPAGVAVSARTFGEAIRARDALATTWSAGTIDDMSDAEIWEQLHSVNLPSVIPDGGEVLEAVFEWPYQPHAPMEVMTAVADVRADSAEIWMGIKMPIIALQDIAAKLGMPESAVTLHVVQAGGSFGRRLYWDAGVHAALVSQAIGRPVRFMYTRQDDMKHGRTRPIAVDRVRVALLGGNVIAFEHRMAGAELDLRHGFGEAITAGGGNYNPYGYSQTVFHLTQKLPYKFGATSLSLHEVPLPMPTAPWRCVYSGSYSTVNEIVVDEIARHLGRDEYEFRRAMLDNDRAIAVLDKVATEGEWGRSLPPGHAQGIGVHDEYKSRVAYLMEVDATDPNDPKVTRATIAVDVGRVVNPRGVASQLEGVVMDGISTAYRTGLHIDHGAVRESSFGDFYWTQMRHAPREVAVHILPPNQDVPGGSGELGVPAATAAAANAYARATGINPRRFPILEPVLSAPQGG